MLSWLKLNRLNFFPSVTSKIILAVVFLFFLIGFVSVLAFSPKESLISWEEVNVAPSALVRAAVRQNYLGFKTEKPLNQNQIKVLKVPSKGAGDLYAIDFNTPYLCGSGGCLYAVYTPEGRSVLSLLLNSKLPKGTPLFSIGEQTRNGFPCLAIAQPQVEEETVSRSRYCYEGRGFTLVNFSVTKGGA
jgi:hypothetical protein